MTAPQKRNHPKGDFFFCVHFTHQSRLRLDGRSVSGLLLFTSTPQSIAKPSPGWNKAALLTAVRNSSCSCPFSVSLHPPQAALNSEPLRGAIVSMGLRGGAGGPKGRNRNLPWPPCKKVIKKLICFLFISTPHPTRFLQIIRILHGLFVGRQVIRAGVAALHVRRDGSGAGFGERGDCGLGCGGWTVLSFLHIVLSFLFSISMPQSGKIKKIKTSIVQFCKNRYMFMYRFGILTKLVVDGTIVRMVLCRYSKTNGCSNECESDERRRHNADTTDG